MPEVIMNGSDKTDFPETLIIYTFLHGKNALERVDAILDPETSLYHSSVLDWVAFSLPSPKMAEFNHLLLFEGMTIENGMSKRVAHIKFESDKYSHYLAKLNKRIVAKRNNDSDCSIKEVYHRLRYEEGSNIVQRIPRHLVAIPKGDERFTFIIFDNDSLRPVFKCGRSTEKKGLTIETASSH